MPGYSSRMIISIFTIVSIAQFGLAVAPFTMSVPSTAATHFDTTELVIQGHPLEQLASAGNAFLQLNPAITTFTHVYPGDTIANPSKIAADLLNQFIKPLYIYATAFEPEITRLLDSSLAFLKNSATATNTSLSTLLTNSRNLYSNYLASPTRNQTLAAVQQLQAAVANITQLSGNSAFQTPNVNAQFAVLDALRVDINIKNNTVQQLGATFDNILKDQNFTLSQIFFEYQAKFNGLRRVINQGLLSINDTISNLISVEKSGFANGWSSVSTFNPVVCGVDGNQILNSNIASVKGFVTNYQNTVNTLVGGIDGKITSFGTQLGTYNVKVTTAQNVSNFLLNVTNIAPSPVAPPQFRNVSLPQISKLVADFVSNIVQPNYLVNSNFVNQMNAMIGKAFPPFSSLVQHVRAVYKLVGADDIYAANLVAAISDLNTKMTASLTAFTTAFPASVTPFFAIPSGSDIINIPVNYQFPQEYTPLNNFAKTFTSQWAQSFVSLVNAGVTLQNLLNNPPSLLSMTLFQSPMYNSTWRGVLQVYNQIVDRLNPVNDGLNQINLALNGYYQWNLVPAFQSAADVFQNIRTNIGAQTTRIANYKSEANKRALILNILDAKVTADQTALPPIVTEFSKALATSTLAFFNLAPIPFNAATAANFPTPSSAVVYRSIVAQFNQTNFNYITNGADFDPTAASPTIAGAYYWSVDLTQFAYAAVPKILVSSFFSPNSTVNGNNGVTVGIPTANPLFVNEKTDAAPDTFWLNAVKANVPALVQYNFQLVSASKSNLLFKLSFTGPIPQVDLNALAGQTNAPQNMASNPYLAWTGALTFNVTVTA
jgi:hypothetical protein